MTRASNSSRASHLAAHLLAAGALAFPGLAVGCQLEYSDWLIGVFRKQGMSLEKRVGSYDSLEQCESARSQAISRSGDPNLANNIRCVACSTGRQANEPSGYSVAPEAPPPAPAGSDRDERFESNKQGLLQSLKGSGVTPIGNASAPAGTGAMALPLKPGIVSSPPAPLPAPASGQPGPVARAEQQEREREPPVWLSRQQATVRQAEAKDRRWTAEVMRSVKASHVPPLESRPSSIADLRPGDVLLIGADQSLIASAVKNLDPLYRAIDWYFLGNVSAPNFKQSPVSHVLTYVRKVKGDRLFLDHQRYGSRVMDEDWVRREYGGRAVYVARPLAPVDGRKLWEAAKQSADYGIIGESLVCSERAAIAVARATGTKMDKERHRLGIFGVIDITPADFFDDRHIGKYFVVSTSPFLMPR